MAMMLDKIVKETKHWPPGRVDELVDRLTEDLHTSAPEIKSGRKFQPASVKRF
jgi:hypothetical protein